MDDHPMYGMMRKTLERAIRNAPTEVLLRMVPMGFKDDGTFLDLWDHMVDAELRRRMDAGEV